MYIMFLCQQKKKILFFQRSKTSEKNYNLYQSYFLTGKLIS